MHSNFESALVAGMSFGVAFLAAASADAAEYYVAPTGSDSNAGTMDQPFATLQKGHDSANAGDTVWVRGGTYKPTKQLKLSKSGSSDAQRIKFFAYSGELPVIDFSGYVSTNKAADTPALLVTGNWLHLKGFEIANVPVGARGDHSISALRSEGASNNIFELLDIHHSFGPGLFISHGTGGNLILNVDSHDNYDKDGSQGDGQNGDGFGVHFQETGPSTVIRGCRAWLDSDDGYDLISQEVPVIIENSWAFQNGYADGGSITPSSGNGNGFKVGSSKKGVRHIVRNNVAWKNHAAGFYANHSSGGNTWLNNTSYMNGAQYDMLASPAGDSGSTIVLMGDLVHRMRNNIGFPNKNTHMDGVDTMFNTWDLDITEAVSDFVSTTDTGVLGPRKADGSLPDVEFLKLKADSPLIDQGTDVMLPFVGTAPDLGADEYGAVEPPADTGGTGGGGSPTAAGMGGSVPTPGGSAAGATGGTPTTDAPGGSSSKSGTTSDTVSRPSGDDTADDGSCSCSSKSQPGGSTAATATLLLGAALRRRKRCSSI
jgi:MYXO-CTERM domain-containing protein